MGRIRTKNRVTIQSKYYGKSGYLARNEKPTARQVEVYNKIKKVLQGKGLVQPDENRIEPVTRSQYRAQIKGFYTIANKNKINAYTGEPLKEGDMGYVKTYTIKELKEKDKRYQNHTL